MAGTQQLRVEPLAPGGVGRLPAMCPGCPLPPGGHPAAAEPWLASAVEAYGCCGVQALLGGTVVGYVLVCPPLHTPVRGPYASAGGSPDAAVVLQFYVHPEYRGRRVGRRMLQELAAILVRRRVGGIEVRAAHVGATCLAPPQDWLLSQGFRVLREEVTRSRLRMDLRSTRSWRPVLAPVMHGVRQLIRRPAAGPEPVGRQCGS